METDLSMEGIVTEKASHIPHPRARLMHYLAIHDGWSLERIGALMGGVSKQRVSQIIHRDVSVSPIDPYRHKFKVEDVTKMCDASYSLEEAASKLHVTVSCLQGALSRFGLLNTYKQRFREKKRILRMHRLVRLMRFMASKLGHTPSIFEINLFARLTRKKRKRIPYHTAWTQAFGSMEKAAIAAQLVPNKRGRQKAVST